MYSMPAMACDAGGGFGAAFGGCVLRIAPMIKNRVPIPIAEMKNDNFLPNDSTPKKMKIAVATTLTTPKAQQDQVRTLGNSTTLGPTVNSTSQKGVFPANVSDLCIHQ